ncbi:hypothetical protein A2T98_00105 [Nodularia spumigena CENA596]|uniref:PAW domain-containing protein n=1 Tax=Nodularia spumigena CENA596 TaxID=1819295 RepID=A0A166L2Z0_NODSP|nr:hypothetical protein A2T98_00105 [Nodularia spumigena CENA596]
MTVTAFFVSNVHRRNQSLTNLGIGLILSFIVFGNTIRLPLFGTRKEGEGWGQVLWVFLQKSDIATAKDVRT